MIFDVSASQITIPLSRDPAFDTLPAVDLLNTVFSRWSILPSGPALTLSSLLPESAVVGRSSHKTRLLGLEHLVIGVVGAVEDIVQVTVLDPLFGGNVIKANGENSDTEWYGTLSVGSPPQAIKLNFDTGSSDLFVFAPNCTTCSLSNHTAFQPSRSSTYKNVTTPWSTAFGDGSSAAGYASSDTVTVTASSSSSSSPSQVSIPNFLFAIATSMSSSLASDIPSGLVGLAQDPLANIPGGTTVFSRMIHGGLLAQNLIGIRLVKGTRDSDGTVGPGGGEYTFGGIESQWIVGGQPGLSWIRVTSKNYWGLPMSGVKMGLKSVLPSSTPPRAIIDTGTSLILTSQALAASINKLIPGSYLSPKTNVWLIPCSTNSVGQSKTPSANLFFVIGGKQYAVPAQDLAWKKIDQQGYWCVSGVQSGVEGFTVLGAMFIKNNYVVLRYNDAKGESVSVGLGQRTDVSPIL
ncbi:hypothetical protein FRB94_010606 [Tulasnella sp. JGI-2019a]|nr:hypothetical protein FRB94_010606 [Tulasnella sp. JGI-2019a]KAG9017845.1 hypothetical protein FRB93_004656 [Tulasnella sp. JGI-2019a]